MSEQQNDPNQQPSKKDMRETGIASLMTSTSMHKHPTAFHNTRLPILQVALNAETMTDRFEPMLAGLAAHGSTPSVTYAKLLAYKQGNRGLIQYEVAGTELGERLMVFGKLYPEPSQAARVYVTMQALWDEVFSSDPAIGVPQPLGCLADLSMLVYLPAGGYPLDDAVTGDRALHYMQLAGRWLGTLHQQRMPLSKTFNLSTEIVNLQAWAMLVAHKYPELGDAANQIAAYLRDNAASLELETVSPIHKDFHYGHIWVDENGSGNLKVIDFDELRLGDPNFDLAHFCANLHLLAYRKNSGPFQYSTLQVEFLRAYARHTGWMPNERCVYFYAYTCLKIAKQLCSMRGLRPRPEGEEQQRQVQMMLDQGMAALPQRGKRLSGKFATVTMEAVAAVKREG